MGKEERERAAAASSSPMPGVGGWVDGWVGGVKEEEEEVGGWVGGWLSWEEEEKAVRTSYCKLGIG